MSAPARPTAPAGRAPAGRTRFRFPVLQGIVPISRAGILRDAVAGLTLAALGVPEVLGYAKIAGMPVVTGLYTILLPIAVFAVLGSSRHLVVGADSATAAVLASGVGAVAALASSRYVAYAGLAALLTGVLLLLARIIRLGFLANFLSRTVLVGFLTGVGIQVAIGQLPGMLGIRDAGSGTVGRLGGVIGGLARVNVPTLILAVAVIAVIVGMRFVARRVPTPLIVVVAAIVVAKLAHLDRLGIRELGAVPQGLPHLTVPPLDPGVALALLGTSASMFIIILAQSAATSRAYAAEYEETFDENVDLVGLGAANLAAAFTGTFPVNGSPTKTQIVDSAGGRSQVAQLTTALVVLVVLLLLTGPLSALPLAVLAAIVFLIGLELIDIGGLRRILAVRKDEFVVAVLTAAAVVFIGVEQGIVFAILASIVDHLRLSYSPRRVVLVPGKAHRWLQVPATPAARSRGGLVVYRFGNSLYYANAHQLIGDVTGMLAAPPPVTLFCLDCAAVGDVDFTAGAVLKQVHAQLSAHSARLVFAHVSDPVRRELDRYGISDLVGADAYYDSPGDLLAAVPSRS